MSYGKIYDSIINSSIMDEGPLVTAVWSLIIANKNRHGVTSLTPRALAKAWRMDTDEGRAQIEKAWDVLSSPDPNSSNKDQEGRRIIPLEDGRWAVVSHWKYQERDTVADRHEKDADKASRYRYRQKKSKGLCSRSLCTNNAVNGSSTCSSCAFTPEQTDQGDIET